VGVRVLLVRGRVRVRGAKGLCVHGCVVGRHASRRGILIRVCGKERAMDRPRLERLWETNLNKERLCVCDGECQPGECVCMHAREKVCGTIKTRRVCGCKRPGEIIINIRVDSNI
jgi:hypothetical protein